MIKINVEDYLKSKGIEYVLHEHPAVYTCEEAEKYCGNIPGLACKNLLLKGKKSGRFFLVILPADKRADLKKISGKVGEKQLSFAGPEALEKKLGLTAGAVSPFGLLNDMNHEIVVYVDNKVYYAGTVGFHPDRNTATLELSGEMFRKFLKTIENKIIIIDL
jgi:Ala-tRNA(Pro) deacylase